MHDRGAEHLELHQKRSPESVLVAHENEAHGGTIVEWSMEANKYTKSNLIRQASEAFLIEKFNQANLLNRRGEWGNNLPPRLSLIDGEGHNGPKRYLFKKRILHPTKGKG